MLKPVNPMSGVVKIHMMTDSDSIDGAIDHGDHDDGLPVIAGA